MIIKPKTDNGCQSPQSVAYRIRRGGIDASVSGWHSRDDEIHVFGHASVAEIHLAEQRATFEEQSISKLLSQRPDQACQVEILLDSERLYCGSPRTLSQPEGFSPETLSQAIARVIEPDRQGD